MRKQTRWIGGSALALAVVAGGPGAAFSTGVVGDDDNESALTGSALEKASAAALAETGGGKVTGSERDDETGAAYEVEVTKDDGSQVDVSLDESFAVVAAEGDDESEDAAADAADDKADGDADDQADDDTDGDEDTALTGATLEKATAAALAETGGGKVTEADTSGDEGAAYDVEVTMDDGTEVDVHLDKSFAVVAETDEEGDD